MAAFDYGEAFSRNLGWVTETEQARLREARVAIAGLGGVGGYHLLTLARLGVGKFNIADLDVFETANFNRQAGAGVSTLGRSKVDVLADMVRDINPECELTVYPQGVQADNLDSFLGRADVYLDGLDFFAIDPRERVFAYCHAHRLPAITAAPLGTGAALLNFMPDSMSFEEYFQLAGGSELDKAVRFMVGLAPALIQRHYLADPTRVNLAAQRGPSTPMACMLCAGIAATEVLKVLLQRGKVWAAPHGFQFDPYRNQLAHTWRPGGNRHPLNRLAIAFVRHRLKLTKQPGR
mgnify:FL=1